ncbi:hypothetical protein RclHR1_14550002 [Rhizophagus clarus]|uniref:F-box domain-containing protein n=1 Tax=Rhizophagus clarus TaxID=94130 RepID=A0A2Z6R5L5_9GLOM|nr:hypothetical protein RclHR1_14550002 [Rhizophagus clarus]
MAVPILWENPFRYQLKVKARKIIINIILSYLSEESRNDLKNQGIDLFTTYPQPLFNYISFWKCLNLTILESTIEVFIANTDITNITKFKTPIVGKEIINVFNKNTKFHSLYNFSSLFISGNERCFSGLEYFWCNATYYNNIIAEGLATSNTSIKRLSFDILYNTQNSGIIKLIEGQKNLKEVKFNYKSLPINNESRNRPLEEALIKCGDTIQYLRIDWKPSTKLFSYLVNLLSLEINALGHKNWKHLENVSLPLLKFLKAHYVPSEILAGLIENTKGNLIEISIHIQSTDEGRLIQAIYQNCRNLNYLKLTLFSQNIPEFENLLINCQFLNGLEIISTYDGQIDWNKLFEVLTSSTPISLFKFKFIYTKFNSYLKINLDSLSLFLDNWKDRRPMLLQIFSTGTMLNTEQKQQHLQKLKDFLQKYKTNGVIKNYEIDWLASLVYDSKTRPILYLWISLRFKDIYSIIQYGT